MSRMMEARHTYIIGMSLLFGLTADAIPGAFQGLPEWLRTLLSSGLTLATVMVVVLNLVFRIGTSKKRTFTVQPGTEDLETVYEFMEESGGLWGARREVVERTVSGIVEAYELISGEGLADGAITIDATFDEFHLDVTLRYPGRLPEQDTGRVSAPISVAEHSVASLASMLLHRLADRVRMKRSGTACEIELRFEH
jgi:NCS2 family nucleobase:cation symporter-2